MDTELLGACYGVIAELLLNPRDRDAARIRCLEPALARAPAALALAVQHFRESPGAESIDEYTQTLELAPPCPLYLGAYLFDDPTSCRGVGASGRNGYMIELTNVYRHFGVQLSARELPDFLPLMVEFLALSLRHPERDRIGLRRRFVEQQVVPGLAPLEAALARYQSPYASLIAALGIALCDDLARMGDTRPWAPPGGERLPRARRSLPVVTEDSPRRKEARP